MKHFAVIGNPIAHSRSPEIHRAFAEQTGKAITYRRIEAPLAPDDSGFADAARRFFADGGFGMNVTAPFKDAAFRLASAVSERSRLAGAANTLMADGRGGWRADNTDGIGLVRDLVGRLGLPLADQRLLVLGAGGASAGILGPLLDARPAQIVLWNRSADKAQRLVQQFAAVYPDAPLSAVSHFSAKTGGAAFDLVIHATSLKVGVGRNQIGQQVAAPAPLSERFARRGSNLLPENTPSPPAPLPQGERGAKGREALRQTSAAFGGTPFEKGAEGNSAWPWLMSLCAPGTFFYDLSYADNEETFFLGWARTCGAHRWSDGFGMLVEQAAESFRIWHGCLPETAPVFAALRPKK
ncbi:MAG: shikimate dehydrogenase [Proteobacteria bacterium]|nr:shikimate dehydrogenase [Pseudomonadota bacterium]MCL2306758.1 shikimate dehydrogenase [Pseudomonadota bacterium]